MNRFEKWSVWSTSILTVATGLGYFVTKYLFTSPDPYSVVSHPWQPFFLKAHIVVSPLLLFALGTITVHHVWDHFVSGIRWSRRSAVLTAAMVVPMVVTGYLVQVFTDQGWVRAMALSHIVFGVVYGAGLLAHTLIIRRGRRGRRTAARRASRGPAAEPAATAGQRAGEGAGDRPERASSGASGAPVGGGAAGNGRPARPPREAEAADDAALSVAGSEEEGAAGEGV